MFKAVMLHALCLVSLFWMATAAPQYVPDNAPQYDAPQAYPEEKFFLKNCMGEGLAKCMEYAEDHEECKDVCGFFDSDAEYAGWDSDRLGMCMDVGCLAQAELCDLDFCEAFTAALCVPLLPEQCVRVSECIEAPIGMCGYDGSGDAPIDKFGDAPLNNFGNGPINNYGNATINNYGDAPVIDFGGAPIISADGDFEGPGDRGSDEDLPAVVA